ncbi:hypothetical protein [uncultured Vagococcus sp.]|nr:hypothetical protein [uncultured Vagococcus sp.]
MIVLEGHHPNICSWKGTIHFDERLFLMVMEELSDLDYPAT